MMTVTKDRSNRLLCPVWILLCFAVLILLCIGCLGCSNQTDPDDSVPAQSETDQTATESETEESFEGLVLDDSFTILCESGTAADNAATVLQTAIQELYGFTLSIQSDKASAQPEKVILIGATSKEASGVMVELRERDYLYATPDDHTVVIGGRSAETLKKAAQAFLEEQYGYTETGTGAKAGVPTGLEKIFRDGSYPFSNLILNGLDAKNITIYHSGTEAKSVGKLVAERITNLTGYVPKILALSGGSTDKQAIYLYSGEGTKYYSIERDQNGSVVIKAPANQLQTAVNEFLSDYFVFTETGLEQFVIETSPLTRLAYIPNTKYDNGLKLVARQDTEVKTGITYTELTYTREDGRPVIVKAVVAQKGAADIMIGSPKAETSIHSLQTPLGQAKAAEQAFDVNVIAAINGDLFDYDTCKPLGPMYQNGVQITEKLINKDGTPAWTKHCFGIKKTGALYIGNQAQSSLWYQLVGGEGIILRNGEVVDVIDDQFFTENHPRSAIGYDADGTLYLVEIDGRQKELSNGASFMDMALIFKYLGATDALNLDGGGSSALFLENQETGELELMTSPSDDGREVRAVANTVLLIDKKTD